MVDSKEDYKFDLGIKGLNPEVTVDLGDHWDERNSVKDYFSVLGTDVLTTWAKVYCHG